MWLAGGLVLVAIVGATVWWLRRRFLIVTVRGPSMRPTYQNGDRLLVRRKNGALRAGEVVVADLSWLEWHPDELQNPPWDPPAPEEHLAEPTEIPEGVEPDPSPENGSLSSRVVKRVAAVAGEATPSDMDPAGPVVPPGQLVLLGDNSAQSVDSRQYGYVPLEEVLGTVVRRLR